MKCPKCGYVIPKRDEEECYEPFASNDGLYMRCPLCQHLWKETQNDGLIPLQKILEESVWVAKMLDGEHIVGKHDYVIRQIGNRDYDEFDLVAKQPDHLLPFFDKYFAYDEKHGFITIQDYYNNVYSKGKEE